MAKLGAKFLGTILQTYLSPVILHGNQMISKIKK